MKIKLKDKYDELDEQYTCLTLKLTDAEQQIDKHRDLMLREKKKQRG